METPFYIQGTRVVLPELPHLTPVRTTRAIQAAAKMSGLGRGTVEYEPNQPNPRVKRPGE